MCGLFTLRLANTLSGSCFCYPSHSLDNICLLLVAIIIIVTDRNSNKSPSLLLYPSRTQTRKFVHTVWRFYEMNRCACVRFLRNTRSSLTSSNDSLLVNLMTLFKLQALDTGYTTDQEFLLPHVVQPALWPVQPSLQWVGGKSAGFWNWPLASNWCWSQENVGLPRPSSLVS
jgi:hypothetical protein